MNRRLHRLQEQNNAPLRNGADRAASPVPPGGKTMMVDEFKAGLYQSAFQDICRALDERKAKHGQNGLEEGAFRGSLTFLTGLYANNGLIVSSQNAQVVVGSALEMVPKAAAAAKARCDEGRVVLVGG